MMKKKIKKSILLVFLVMLSTIFIISAIKTIAWFIDNKNTKDISNKLDDKVVINEYSNEDNINSDNIDEFDPYWDYIKMKLIDVDFSKLYSINKDVKGWIQVKGTNINYPFVQTTNNKYYLTHSFYKKYNSAGWVFMDYRNKYNDKNTIIYGHGRLNKTMFGSLKNILTSDWLDNKNNYIVKTSTKEYDSMWQVFSVYHIKTTSDYLNVNFNNDNDFLEFANMLKNRSLYDFKTSLSKNDKILTLSTCYNNSEKMVMHAKLIKRKVK